MNEEIPRINQENLDDRVIDVFGDTPEGEDYRVEDGT